MCIKTKENTNALELTVDGYGSEEFLTAHFNADFLKSLKADADKGFFWRLI